MANKAHISTEKVRHVHDHLTPLAVIVVVPGLLVADIPQAFVAVASGLLCFSVLINAWTVLRAGKKTQSNGIGKFRVVANYAINIVLLWVLYAHWPPIWLLLLLMAAGVAVYQPRQRALVSSLCLAMVLLAVHSVYGAPGGAGWVEAAVRACVLITFALFVNGIKDLPAKS